jgi:hypothetical protein
VALLILACVSALLSVAFVFGLFIWAARRDGEYDRSVQRRLGIRRKTWLWPEARPRG